MQHLCSECGAVIAPGSTICPSCGAKLDDSAPTQPLTPPSDTVPTRPLVSLESVSSFSEPVQSPPRKKRLALLIMLPLLCLLVLVGLGAGGFWFYMTRPHSAPPALYSNSLTKREPAWQCEKGALCQNDAHGLHILATTDHLYFSALSGKSFSEQVIEVKTKLDNGNPQFVGVAIAFRSVGLNGYGLLVFANGVYQLVKWDDAGAATNLIPLTRSSLIHTGLNQINTLKIIAKGQTLTIFVNGHQLQQVSDATFSSGGIALGAARFAADAVFSNLVITMP